MSVSVDVSLWICSLGRSVCVHSNGRYYQPCVTKARDDNTLILSLTDSLGILGFGQVNLSLLHGWSQASLCFLLYLYSYKLQQESRHPSQNFNDLRLVLLQVLFPAASKYPSSVFLQVSAPKNLVVCKTVLLTKIMLVRIRCCACDLCCLCTFSSFPLFSLKYSFIKKKSL